MRQTSDPPHDSAPQTRRRRSNSHQGLSQQALHRCTPKRRILSELAEHRANLPFAKPQASKRSEYLRLRLGTARLRRLTVRGAVGMTKDRRARRAFHDELTAVQRAMVRAADAEDILGGVPAALGPQLDVMEIEIARMAASGHPAAVLIAMENRSP